jgi:NAD(P)-dependent dehydrogenase (short-subunit alcohol dehydrogenase family)
MGGLCAGRVAIVTGAGRGIGREHALMLASEGAKVVVDDLGGATDGSGSDLGPAKEVVAEIESQGGEAIASAQVHVMHGRARTTGVGLAAAVEGHRHVEPLDLGPQRVVGGSA